MNHDLSRRMFVAGALAAAACHRKTTTTAAMPMSVLGKTGVKVSRIGIGGFHLGKPPEEEALRIVRSALDRGVTSRGERSA